MLATGAQAYQALPSLPAACSSNICNSGIFAWREITAGHQLFSLLVPLGGRGVSPRINYWCFGRSAAFPRRPEAILVRVCALAIPVASRATGTASTHSSADARRRAIRRSISLRSRVSAASALMRCPICMLRRLLCAVPRAELDNICCESARTRSTMRAVWSPGPRVRAVARQRCGMCNRSGPGPVLSCSKTIRLRSPR